MQHTLHSDALHVLGMILAASGSLMVIVFAFVGWYLAPDVALHVRLVAPILGGFYLSGVFIVLGIIALLVYRRGERIWVD